jgi:c-di-GMP-binding flagellar brake protein YcgR
MAAPNPEGVATESMSNDSHERRSSERFAVAWQVRYSVLSQGKVEETGIGQTVNISSCGVLFSLDQGLRLGQLLELSISWPVLVNNKFRLKLVARGKVVRVEPGRVAMEIEQYEFLQSSNPTERLTTESMSKDPRERRSSQRFSMEWELHYRVLSQRKVEETGIGQTVNISSCGVLFSSDHGLRPKQRLELSISWPVLVNNTFALKLVARGKVVRLEPGRVAMRIQQYEFRTQSSNPIPSIDTRLAQSGSTIGAPSVPGEHGGQQAG